MTGDHLGAAENFIGGNVLRGAPQDAEHVRALQAAS